MKLGAEISLCALALQTVHLVSAGSVMRCTASNV
jgi:hypothetical protein